MHCMDTASVYDQWLSLLMMLYDSTAAVFVCCTYVRELLGRNSFHSQYSIQATQLLSR